ncbi:hypothetical protein PIROE2DRAFT_63397 [Piromyces sp. E2]|nr:hypothetical protein PIROE2DRAFT_63397 [Piromyces sp. E2]|eukprot:OUM60020.1 hypothetical protein PIROE2DRAFT_63397 [Piromyces sp. E2]
MKFQREEFTIRELDKICNTLKVQYANSKLFNPHKSVLPIGNYDVNVIMWALDIRGKEIQWFDNRHLDELEQLDIDKLFGIIINKGSKGSVFSKHWYTLRPVYKSDARMAMHEKILRPKNTENDNTNDKTNDNTTNNINNNSNENNNEIPHDNTNNNINNNSNENDNENNTYHNSNENNNETNNDNDKIFPMSPPKIPPSNLTSTKTTITSVTVDSNNNNYSVTEESPKTSKEIITENNDDKEDYDFNWWNLDSKLQGPVRFVSKEAVIIFYNNTVNI